MSSAARVLCALTTTLALACSTSEPPAPGPSPFGAAPGSATAATGPAAPGAKKDPAAAKALVAAGAAVVDVRTPDEFTEGHLARAANIPVQEFAQRIGEVSALVGGDKTKPVVVYCAAGSRAAKAKQQLEAAGYTQVVNGGGYDDLR